MNQLERAIAWIRYAEATWWNPSDLMTPIRNSEHVTNILEILRRAMSTRNYSRVLAEIGRVKAKYITMSRWDAGVAQQLCGHAALDLEIVPLAREMFYDARDNLSRGNKHHFAVATWMLGCIYWLNAGDHNRGIDAWQETINIFERLGWDAATGDRKTRWYRKTRDLIVKVLAYAIEFGELPDPRDFIPGFVTPPSPLYVSDIQADEFEQEPTEDKRYQEPGAPIPIDHYLQLFVVYDKIPAGLPAEIDYVPTRGHPVHRDMEPDDYIEVTRMRIGGQEYKIETLKRVDRQVSLINDWQYYSLRVRGISMNQAGIDDGDLVFLRYQVTADSGDIVAAVLVDDKDPEIARNATLKRFLKRGEQISLRAVSNDPDFEKWERTFTREELESQEKVIIYGVAVAVLKPV